MISFGINCKYVIIIKLLFVQRGIIPVWRSSGRVSITSSNFTLKKKKYANRENTY